MRALLSALAFLLLFMGFSQIPLYHFRELEKTLTVPSNINRERTVVIVQVPDIKDEFIKVGAWESLSSQAHKAFITMGIDPILYLNHYDLLASDQSLEIYSELFSKRRVKNLLFITQTPDSFELIMAPFDGTKNLVANGAEAFYMTDPELYQLLLKTGKEIRRADYEIFNFLVPEKPNFLAGISIIDKTQLKNYPGILRRSTLAVERFALMPSPDGINNELQIKIEQYNDGIKRMNEELELLIKDYPYDYVIIDPMSDQDLLRNKHQFILRSIHGQAKTLREMLDYKVDASETDFISVIPIIPDQTRAKRVPRNALVHKFYIKQNISKNVHVGEWDADETWQAALSNMIGNLTIEHKSGR